MQRYSPDQGGSFTRFRQMPQRDGIPLPDEDPIATIDAIRGADPAELADYLTGIDRTDPTGPRPRRNRRWLVPFPAPDDEWHLFVDPTRALHSWDHKPNPEGVLTRRTHASSRSPNGLEKTDNTEGPIQLAKSGALIADGRFSELSQLPQSVQWQPPER
jgi:hypothetical protein